MRVLVLLSALLAAPGAWAQVRCGEVRGFEPPAGGRFAVSLAVPAMPPVVVLLLLPGGNGVVDLDDGGCAQGLRGNSLVRAMPAFVAGGAVAALVDAPAEWRGRDGLAGFRVERGHAEALGIAIRALREAYRVPVWLVGTSRGAISAANAATALSPPAAPDGVVLTSPVSAGLVAGSAARASRPWVAHDVFGFPLGRIAMPLLVLGHAADSCRASPPANVERIVEAAQASPRRQAMLLEGGPGSPPGDPLACEGRSPHGFIGQDAEMAAAILRFVR